MPGDGMRLDGDDSLVSIVGRASGARGSGFVIWHKGADTYILTCKHVVADACAGDVGRTVLISEKYPAKVIYESSALQPDLTVLVSSAPELQEKPALKIGPISNADSDWAYIKGYFRFGRETLSSTHSFRFLILNSEQERDVFLRQESDVQIIPGHSGSPVLDSNLRYVIAVVYDVPPQKRPGSTRSVIKAVPILRLGEIWPNIPSEIFFDSKKEDSGFGVKYDAGMGGSRLADEAFDMWFSPLSTRQLVERIEGVLETAINALSFRNPFVEARLCIMMADQFTNFRNVGRAREYILRAKHYLSQLDNTDARALQILQDIVWIGTIVEKLSGNLKTAIEKTGRALAEILKGQPSVNPNSGMATLLWYNYYRLLRSQISYIFEGGQNAQVPELIDRLQIDSLSLSPLNWAAIDFSRLAVCMQISDSNARRLLTYDLLQIQRRVFSAWVSLGQTVKATAIWRLFADQYLHARESSACDAITHITFYRLLGALAGRCAIGTNVVEKDQLILLMKKAYSIEKRWTLQHKYDRERIIKDPFYEEFFHLSDLDALDTPYTVQEERNFLTEAKDLLYSLHSCEPVEFLLRCAFEKSTLPTGVGQVHLEHLNLFCAFDCSEAEFFKNKPTTIAQEMCDTALAFLAAQGDGRMNANELGAALDYATTKRGHPFNEETKLNAALIFVSLDERSVVMAKRGAVSFTLELPEAFETLSESVGSPQDLSEEIPSSGAINITVRLVDNANAECEG